MSAVLYTARRVRTMDPRATSGPPADAVLVDQGRVVAVGRAADLRREHAGRVVDLDGVITPGLVDGHTHPVHGVEMTAGLDLSESLDLDAVRILLAAERSRLEPGQWLQAWGLNPVVFDGAEPTARALGIEGVLAVVVLYDGHSAVVSPEVLALAGIDGPREFASASRIGLDADGVPTGYLLEAEAKNLVDPYLPQPSVGDLAEGLLAAGLAMARTGLTGMHAVDLREPSLEVLTAAEELGDLPVRMSFRPMLMPSGPSLAEVLAQQGTHGRRWEVRGVKLVVDGTIDGGTAWLEYADTHGEGLDSLWTDLVAFREVVTELHRAGIPVAVHAIGDRGVREVLTLLEGLTQQYGPLARHRIEHIETIPLELADVFARSGVAASMQPLHLTAFNHADRSDSWSQRLGDERVDRGFPWSRIREAGGVLALGSDWPIAPFDARWTMADAQLRRRFDRPDAAPIHPELALTAEQALEGYTTHAALASGEEDHRGRLAPGYDADFTVFAADPLELEPEELGRVDIVTTVVEGVEVF